MRAMAIAFASLTMASAAHAADIHDMEAYDAQAGSYWETCPLEMLSKIKTAPHFSAHEKPASCIASKVMPVGDDTGRFFYVWYTFPMDADSNGKSDLLVDGDRVLLLLENQASANTPLLLAPEKALAWKGWINPPHPALIGGRKVFLLQYGTGNKDGKDVLLAAEPGLHVLDVDSWLSDAIDEPEHYVSSRATAVDYKTMSASVVFSNDKDYDFSPNTKRMGETDIDLAWQGDKLGIVSSHYVAD